MDRQQPQPQAPAPELSSYTSVADWLDREAGPFFETRSSLDWFIKRNRRELIEDGALIPREGRSGSLVSIERFPKAVIAILRRRALGRGRPATERTVVEIARALRDLQALWRPPDPEKDNARREPGADETEVHKPDSTPPP